jgi:4-amino-4-deoxy-L-arabinose transferase-like glycosyltransferase
LPVAQTGDVAPLQRLQLAAPSGLQVAVGLLVFGALWLAHLGFVSLSPPTDNLEQLTWVRALQWGYYKHPPLPTWLIWLPVQLLGLTAAAPALLGAACTLGAIGLLWWLLVQLRGRRHATVALLAVLCISFYNGRLDYYNHNVVLMLLSTASAALCWLAFTTGRWRWFLGLGLALGLGALTKYQIALTAAALLAFAVSQRAWRRPRLLLGLALAAAVALLLLLPHLVWLVQHDFPPMRYAMATSLDVRLGVAQRGLHTLRWLLDQLFNRSLPALLLLAWAAYGLRRKAPAGAGLNANPPAALAEPGVAGDAARALLLAWGLVPLLAMVLLGVATGANLQLHWGTPFLPLTVPALMELLPRLPWSRTGLRRLGLAFLLLQGLLMLLSHLSSPRGWAPMQSQHWRSFASQALAQRLADPARQQLGGPVRVVSGDAVLAGALALRLPERPLVLIDGRLDFSPWVPQDLVARCGLLQLGPLAALPGGQALGAPFKDLGWRVQPPAAGAGACVTPGPGVGPLSPN